MIKLFEDFLTEKLGISQDVVILYEFLKNEIENSKSDKKLIIDKNIPENISFKIDKIIIKFINSFKITGALDLSRSKLTKNGYIIYLLITKDSDLKNTLYHELTHVIRYQNLTTKKIKMISSTNFYPDQRFSNLTDMLYHSDDSEINSKLAEIFTMIENYMKIMKPDDRNMEFKNALDLYVYNTDDDPNFLINYDIFDDLKDVSDKDKIKFFKYMTNIKNIRKNYNNKFIKILKVIQMVLGKNDIQEIDLNNMMKKTQYFINKQGEKLLKKIHKLYGLI